MDVMGVVMSLVIKVQQTIINVQVVDTAEQDLVVMADIIVVIVVLVIMDQILV